MESSSILPFTHPQPFLFFFSLSLLVRPLASLHSLTPSFFSPLPLFFLIACSPRPLCASLATKCGRFQPKKTKPQQQKNPRKTVDNGRYEVDCLWALISAHRGKMAGGRRWWWLWTSGRRKNRAHCTVEIKILEKAALSDDWDKSSSSRHSGSEFNSSQPFLKERLISCSIACCATSQAGMHRVVSLTPAH